jgi:hypothetical protein
MAFVSTPAHGRSVARVALAAVLAWVGIAVVGAERASANADTIIYGTRSYGSSTVVEINLTEQSFRRVGQTARENQASDQDPATGRVYYYEWRTTADEFGYWDPTTGSNTIVRIYSPVNGFYAKRMAFAPNGVLYMMDADEYLYTIDKHTGDLTRLGRVSGITGGPQGGTGDMAFAPDGTLYVATYAQLYTVDIASRTSTLLYDDMIDLDVPGVTLWTGLAFCDGMLYASNGEEESQLSSIFSIDPATGATEQSFYLDTLVNDLTSCPAGPGSELTTPAAPTGLVAEGGDGLVELSWAAASDDGGSPIIDYVIEQRAMPSGDWSTSSDGTSTQTNATITGLTNGAGYEFRVAAVNAVGIGQVSDTAVATPGVQALPSVVSRTTSRTTTVSAPTGVTANDHVAIHTLLIDRSAQAPTWTTTAGFALRYQRTKSVGSGYYYHWAAFDSAHRDVSHLTSYTVNPGRTALYQISQAMRVVNTAGFDAGAGAAADGRIGTATLTLPTIAASVDGTLVVATISAGSTTTVSGVPSGWTEVFPESDEQYVHTRLTDPGPTDATVVTFSGISGQSAVVHAFLPLNGNAAPVAQAGSATTAENTPVGVNLTASDVDNDPLTYTVVNGPTRGTLSGTAPNLTYTPNPGTTGTDSFTFRANDGTVDSNTATITITVTAQNDPPVAQAGMFATNEDTAVGVLLSASDPDGDPLTYTVVTSPTRGTLSGTAPNLTYTPNPNLSGGDSFTFRANDGTVDSNTATVTITVTAVNDAPVAGNGSATTAENTPVGVNLTASDVDNDPLTYTVVTGPTRGTLSGTAPNLTYTPNPGTTGTDSFTFRARDGTIDSNTAIITITVNRAAAPQPSVVSRATSATRIVSAPAGVAPADHVAIHTVIADQRSTPPNWSATAGFVLRYQRTKAVGSGYYYHWAAFDSDGSDVSALTQYSISPGRTVLAQLTQAFRVVDSDGYAGAAAAEGLLSSSTLTVPSITAAVDGTAVFATISAGAATTVSSGPAGWSQPFAESNDQYLYSIVAQAGTVESATVSFTGASAQTVLVHAFLPRATAELEAPSGLVATAGDGVVHLSWTAPPSTVTSYEVQYRDRRDAGWTTHVHTGTATATNVTGLTNYDEYEFRVAAVANTSTSGFSTVRTATPSDGNDPAETFNHPDGPLTAHPKWVPVDPLYGDLHVVGGRVVGTHDPDGTGSAYTTPVGVNLEVTIDARLGHDYNEVSAVLRMRAPDDLSESYLLQWVTDGHWARQGTIHGPTLQIWRLGPTQSVLIAESYLPDEGERTLTFGANGDTLYIAEGALVHLSVTDTAYSTGDYFALAQSNLSGGAMSEIDNLRWRALDGTATG